MKILHVITGLFTGGAEMMLYKLLSRLPSAEATNAVVSLTGTGPIGARVAQHYSLDAIAARYFALYRETLAARKR